jgi:hypothetical protein
MAKHPLWSDEYWVLLIQLYLKKPVGVKPLYSRGLVNMSIELHIHPHFLYEQMFHLRRLDSPLVKKLWDKYSNSAYRLQRDVKLLRRMNGFNNADMFYQGVEVNESFEKDFKPLAVRQELTPVMLILILDLYFHLTPITMVADTPEIQELAQMMKIGADTVAEVMGIFQYCDPYLKREENFFDPLLGPCEAIWNRFGNDNPENLSSLAAQLKEYFK